jgi:predicted RNA methylase
VALRERFGWWWYDFPEGDLMAQLDQFFTDPKLAARIGHWTMGAAQTADVVGRSGHSPLGLRLLEPSAGGGSLVQGLLEAGFRPEQITAIEKDKRLVPTLVERFPGVRVIQADFMRWKPDCRFDFAVMNPPYRGGQAEAHVFRALTMADRVVPLVLSSFTFTADRYRKVWANARARRRAHQVNRPKFHGPDCNGHTAQYDYQVIDLENHKREPGQVDHVLEEFWLSE